MEYLSIGINTLSFVVVFHPTHVQIIHQYNTTYTYLLVHGYPTISALTLWKMRVFSILKLGPHMLMRGLGGLRLPAFSRLFISSYLLIRKIFPFEKTLS